MKEEHPSVSGVIDFMETFERTATSDEWETRMITGHYNNVALERHEQRTGHLTSRTVDSEDVRVDWVEDDDYDYWYWMRETDETVAHRPVGGLLTGQTDVGFWSDNSNIDEALTWPVDPNDDPLPLDTPHAIDPPPGELFPGGAAVPGPAESKEGEGRSFGKLFVDAAAHAWDTTVYFGGTYVDYLGIELATAGRTIVETGDSFGTFVGDHASMAYYDSERELGRVKDGAVSTWQGLSALSSQIYNDPWGTLSSIGSATANYLDRLTRDPEAAGQLLGDAATAWATGGTAAAGKQVAQKALSTLWKLGRTADKVTPDEGFARPTQVNVELPTIQCFAPDTLVATPGGQVAIDCLRPGDHVWSYDFEEGNWIVDSISERHDNYYDGPVVALHTDAGVVETTVYHPFWVSDGRDLAERPACRELEEHEDEGPYLLGRWVNSHDLRPGDVLVGQGGVVRRLLRIEQRHEERFRVVNLTIERGHTFAVGADALLVHNTVNCNIAIGDLARKLLRDALGDNPHPVAAHAHHILPSNQSKTRYIHLTFKPACFSI